MSADLTGGARAEEHSSAAASTQGAAFVPSPSDLAMRPVLERISDGFFALDTAWRVSYVNPYAARVAGRPPEELVGRDIRELFPERASAAFFTRFQEAFARGQPCSFEERSPELERWLELHVYPSGDGISVLFRDVTERRRAVDELREREGQLRLLMEQMPAVLWATDRDLRITSLSGAGLARLGRRQGEGVGRSVASISAFDSTGETLSAHLQALSGASVAYEPGWAGRVFTCYVDPLRGPGEDIVGAVGIGIDCTERRRAEDALRFLRRVGDVLSDTLDFEETLQRALHLPIPFLADVCLIDLLDPDGTVHRSAAASADPASRDLVEIALRYTPDPQRQPETWKALSTGEPYCNPRITEEQLDAAVSDPADRAALRRLAPRSAMVVPLLHKEKVFGIITLVACGEARAYGALELDLARQFAARVATELEHSRLFRASTLLAQASEIFANPLDLDEAFDRLIRVCVPALADWGAVHVLEGDRLHPVATAHREPGGEGLFRELLGRYPHGVESLPLRVALDGEPMFVPTITPEMLEAVASCDEALAAFHGLDPGSYVACPLWARGRSLGTLELARSRGRSRFSRADAELVRELARRAAMLLDTARMYRDAQSAANARDSVLAMVCHDLRNPLATVSLTAQLIASDLPEGELRDAAGRRVAAIERAVSRMTRMVQDLVDIAALDAGRLAMKPVLLDPAAIAEEALEQILPLCAERGIRVEREWGELGVGVLADQGRVLQVFSNLLGNATKASRTGGRIRLGLTHDSAASMVRFSVTDEGPGIAPENLPHVFDRFWRGRSEDRLGVGLGLAIAKGFVEALGGRIGVQSRQGEGSTFHFTLPAARAPGTAQQEPAGE